MGLIIAISKKHMPRDYRKDYIPGWNEISENLYQEFIDRNVEIADDLLIRLKESRRENGIKQWHLSTSGILVEEPGTFLKIEIQIKY